MSRIGIYGGSFNPVHNGHVLAAREFLRLLKLDCLQLIPANDPPHKMLPAFTPSPADRFDLLSIAMRDIPGVTVSDMELKREGKSYSIETVEAIHEENPNDELYLLMGSDMLLSFETWKRFESLFQLATIGVLCRMDRNENERMMLEACAERFRREYGAKIVLLENQRIEVSSTTARRMLFFGCGEEYVPNAVFDAICKRGLYGTGGNYRNLPTAELMKIALSIYDAKRVPHAIGCAETARKLAEKYGADPSLAERAGILHDVTKALRTPEQLRLCEKYAIMTGEYSGAQAKLLHGKTAASIAKHIFGECDAVCESISWHTTGKANMTALEKIVYLADYIEPNRDFDGVEQMRALAQSDLDAAVLLGMEETIRILREQGRPLNRYTVEARDYLLQERESNETVQQSRQQAGRRSK